MGCGQSLVFLSQAKSHTMRVDFFGIIRRLTLGRTAKNSAIVELCVFSRARYSWIKVGHVLGTASQVNFWTKWFLTQYRIKLHKWIQTQHSFGNVGILLKIDNFGISCKLWWKWLCLILSDEIFGNPMYKYMTDRQMNNWMIRQSTLLKAPLW